MITERTGQFKDKGRLVYLSHEDEKLLDRLIDRCNKDEEYIISEALKHYEYVVDIAEKVYEIERGEIIGN